MLFYITNKTRKVLWGKSGNRCAICKRELVIDATEQNDESVVGDECHIISPKVKGPRHAPTYPQENLDAYDNLMLLCRVHHKMVDDQEDSYTTDILRQMKTNHEIWVAQKLSDKSHIPKPVKLRRVKQNVPRFLSRLTTGKEVLDLVTGCFLFSMDHDELNSEEEVDLVGDFLQTVRDWGDIGDALEPTDRVKTAYSLTQSLKELEETGFYVFGRCEVQLLEGGFQSEPSSCPVAILNILRKDNSQITTMNMEDVKDEGAQQTHRETTL